MSGINYGGVIAKGKRYTGFEHGATECVAAGGCSGLVLYSSSNDDRNGGTEEIEKIIKKLLICFDNTVYLCTTIFVSTLGDINKRKL